MISEKVGSLKNPKLMGEIGYKNDSFSKSLTWNTIGKYVGNYTRVR